MKRIEVNFHWESAQIELILALALTLYYFPGLSATANACFRLVKEFDCRMIV